MHSSHVFVGTNYLKQGECCIGSTLDPCGVCGGGGVAVDILGTCCSQPLPPSGICCELGVDSCGVCGGLSSCGAFLTVRTPLEQLSALTAFGAVGIAAALGVPVMAIINASVVATSSPSPTSDGGGSGSRDLGSAHPQVLIRVFVFHFHKSTVFHRFGKSAVCP